MRKVAWYNIASISEDDPEEKKPAVKRTHIDPVLRMQDGKKLLDNGLAALFTDGRNKNECKYHLEMWQRYMDSRLKDIEEHLRKYL